MDISKLPKLSETQKEQQAQAAADAQIATAQPVDPVEPAPPRDVAPVAYAQNARAEPIDSTAGDVWISIAIGAILLLLYPRFLQWVSWRLFGTNFNQFLDQQTGAVVPYTQVPAFWSDLGPTLFGVVLIVEGIALALARRLGVMMFAFGLTVIATAYNAIYVAMSFNRFGFAIISALAVIFGVYIAMYQWKLIQSMSGPAGAPAGPTSPTTRA